jgi:predicted DNA-binding transcriptional regulator AlpA
MKTNAKPRQTVVYQEPRRLLTITEAAQRLGIAEQTIRNGISRKSDRTFPLKPKRLGRKVLFDSLDIDRFIDELPYDDNQEVGD